LRTNAPEPCSSAGFGADDRTEESFSRSKFCRDPRNFSRAVSAVRNPVTGGRITGVSENRSSKPQFFRREIAVFGSAVIETPVFGVNGSFAADDGSFAPGAVY